MSTDVVKFAFIAGEISPTLFGRSDLTKYDLGMALAQNFFVDYRGGLSTRPGLEFGDHIKADDKAVRAEPFEFAPDLSNTYMLLFGDLYVRFIQSNAYVLEDSKAITDVTNDSPGVVTVTSHGYANGRWVKISGVVGMTELNGKTYEIANVTTHTFTLKSVPAGVAVDTSAFLSYASGGIIEAVYEVVTPYPAAALEGLGVFQYRDLMRLTHADYPTYNLVRTDHTNWALSLEDRGVGTARPTIGSHSVTTAGTSIVVFAVTAVMSDGSETIRGPLYRVSDTNNYTATEGSVKIVWGAVADAVSYNVYRSIISSSITVDEGTELGYVGKSNGLSFVDPNIIPDYTKKPPINSNPFEPGAIDYIEITAGGSGYTAFGTTVSITDPDGSEFIGQVVVSSTGAIAGVIILSHGKGYTAPTVVFTGAGTGATATANLLGTTGLYPSESIVYQQRQLYAASTLHPLRVWGSQPKRFSNFNSTELVLPNDAFEFDLDSPSIAPIRHMLLSRGGVVLMTQQSVWLLNGGSSGESLTPTQALAEPQTYNGASPLRPIHIGPDIVYSEGRGYAIRMLSYNEISKVYSGEDRSILSNHLFGPERTLVKWAYQESPFKVVWAVREDGHLISFTSVKDEDVFAWTQGQTKGLFEDIINIREDIHDRVYVITKRYINGRWTKFFERMALRNFVQDEDAWCVDAGLTNTPVYPAADLTISPEADDRVTLTATTAVFGGSAGKVVRAAGGKFIILTGANKTATAEVKTSATELIPEDDELRVLPVLEGEWTMDTPETVFRGLDHLEGETVSILGDGNVFAPQVVVDGSITLSDAVTRVIVGLKFRCAARTMPMIVANAGIEARRKRVVGVAVRLDRSRGLKIGLTLDEADLYEIRERTTEDYGQSIHLIDGVKYQILSTDWNEEGQTYFVQDDPLPVTLLGLVSDIEVGDDPD